MNIVAVQFDITWENKAANFEKVRRLLRAANPEKDSLVVLPEMFATGFSMNAEAIAESYNQSPNQTSRFTAETECFLSDLAKELGTYIIGGAAMLGKDGRPRNKALFFGPNGELIGFYAKMRPFSPGGEREQYTAGERPVCFELKGIHLAPFVCYDLRFPELFRNIAATDRPELFVVIANWPEKRVLHWVRLLQARAIENQAYVVGVNRIGADPFYTYPGRSVIVDFNGEIIADAQNSEQCIQARLDLEPLRKYRQGLPFLEDLKL
jgi:omega-amidase